MQPNALNRRGFLRTVGTGLAAAASSAFAQGRAIAAPGDGAADAAARGDAKNFHPFHTRPASAIDLGLSPEQERRALELHKSLTVFDGETEVTWYGALYDNILQGGGAGVGGSFTVGSFGIESAHGLAENLQIKRSDWWARETLDRDIAFMRRQELEYGDKILLCRNSADLESAQAQGRIGVMLDVQNTLFIGNDSTLLERYRQAGISRVQLTYNRTVPAGTGCMEPRDGGLTLFGREVVERLNELGMLVDTGHCSPNTVIDAAAVSSKPIACSHAGLRSVAPAIRRTQPDAALRKLAETGGVFGWSASPGHW